MISEFGILTNVKTHLMDTPKHLIAIAASKKTAALGKVRWATEKNEA